MPPNSSAISTSDSLPLCTEASDSPLSTTANLLSILTFALGLFASYVALVSATRGAPEEIKRLVEDLRTTQREINRVAEYIFDDMHGDPPLSTFIQGTRFKPHSEGVDIDGQIHNIFNGSRTTIPTPPMDDTARCLAPFSTTSTLYDEVQSLLKTCIILFYDADNLLKRSEKDPYGLRRRILFAMNRNEVTEKVARLADQKAKLAAIQMSLYLRKSAQHDAVLGQIASFVQEMKNGGRANHTSHRSQERSSSSGPTSKNG